MLQPHRRPHPAAAIAVVALAASCSDKSSGGPGIPLEDAPREIARSVCPRAYGCCMPMQLMNNDLAGKDEPSCELKTQEGFRKHLDGARRAIEKKRLVYRGDNLATCLSFIRSAKCEELNRTNHFTGLACEPYLEPQQPHGAPCDGDGECIDGFCEKPASGSGDSLCRPWPGEGQSCAERHCAKGLACTGPDKTCAVVLPEGAVCTAAGQCASGNCANFFGGSGTCGPPPTAANQCFYSSACSYGAGRAAGGGAGALGALLLVLVVAGSRRARRA